MKICMVSEHASPLALLGGVDAGGQNVHVAALSSALARRGAQVVVHTRRDSPGPPRRVPLTDGVEVDHVPAGPTRPVPKDDLPPYMGGFAADLRDQWTRERPDVVHAHFWMSGTAALAAARPLGIPVVFTSHALGVVKRRHQGSRDTSPPDRVQTEASLVREVDAIVATCTDELFELVRLGAPGNRVSVVPSGVDLAAFTPHGPAAARAPGRFRVLFVGRLVERKGIGNLIEAVAALPGTELLIAGGSDRSELDHDAEAGRLRRLARLSGAGDRVTLLGRVGRAELPALYRSADVVACVPWYEPFGIVPVEAMACGVPVVASAVGGLIDTVVDGGTGLHVPPRCPERIVEALSELAADPDERARLGAAGARRAQALFSWDRVSALTMNVYRRLREAHGQGGKRAGIRTGARRPVGTRP
ncbi:glycosyltransferase [Parafrankia discariae]|uniref:glycosyltransferase n=1 Tax=Parafrankia discariae TaxID=365528 RepID=UPI0003A1DAA5|nr:glycosyltransferase [Parafrankia discariae]